MDQEAVRAHAQAHCDALLAGDVERAAAELSEELRADLMLNAGGFASGIQRMDALSALGSATGSRRPTNGV